MTTITLSPRQAEVLRFVADGGCRKTAQGRLGIADGTFRQHLQIAYRKLGVRSDAQAVAKALRLRLID